MDSFFAEKEGGRCREAGVKPELVRNVSKRRFPAAAAFLLREKRVHQVVRDERAFDPCTPCSRNTARDLRLVARAKKTTSVVPQVLFVLPAFSLP